MSNGFSINRRRFIEAAGASALLLSAGGASAQGAWPTREVKLIVPFSAGGGTDLVSRLFAQQLTAKLGQTFFVENLAGGAGGSVGSLELARAPADGYTIGSGTSSGIVTAAIDDSDYNPLRDLDPVARYGATTIALVINPALPPQTFEEFLDYARENPGVTYASSGVGSANHLAGVMLAQSADLDLTHVPYRGEGAALADVLSGVVDALFVSLPAGRVHIESGAMRAFAVTSPERFPLFPDLPTMVELGFENLIVEAWYGMYVPKGTPDEIRDLLVQSVNEIRQDPEVLRQLIDQFTFNSEGEDTPETFRAYMEAEFERFREAALAAGLARA